MYYWVWEVDLCGAFRKIGHWNQLNVCYERDWNLEMGIRDVTWNAMVASTCEGRKPGLLCWANSVKKRTTDTWVLEWNLKWILAMSFCRLAWKEKVVKAVEALTDQCLGRIGEWGRVKAWMVYVLAVSSGVSYGVLMLLLGCEGMSSFLLRWLVGGAWIGSNTHECVPTNKWEFELILHTKIMEPTRLGGGPWLLCWA